MKILIADSQPIALEGIRHLLDEDARFDVVATVQTGAGVLPLVARTRPDVALLNANLPGMDGYDCLVLLQEQHPEIRVVMLGEQRDSIDLVRAFSLGASGVILKDGSEQNLASALYEAATVGGYSSAPSASKPRHNQANAMGLTDRETEVVRAVADGLSNREIAQRLNIAEPTVKFHLSNVYRQLRVTNRTEAARWALSTGVAAGGERHTSTTTGVS